MLQVLLFAFGLFSVAVGFYGLETAKKQRNAGNGSTLVLEFLSVFAGVAGYILAIGILGYATALL